MIIFLFYISIFLIGLAFGSFLNCLIYRLAKHKSLWGRSQCTFCQKQIEWYDNIPIISFIILGRRCRHCHKKISWQYPLIELAMGLLFVFSVWRLNTSLGVIAYQPTAPSVQQYIWFVFAVFRDWIVFFTLIFIFVYDLKYSKIEDVVLLPAAGLVFVLHLVVSQLPNSAQFGSFLTQLGSIVVAVIIPVCFFGFQYFITKGKGVGLGDTRIGLFMGAALGSWQPVLIGLFFSYVIGALVCGILLVLKRKKIKSQIPLGPFLVIGTIVAYFYTQQIINFYFH